MPQHPIASPNRISALAVCLTALALVVAGPASARPEKILTEHAGDTPTAALPQVGDRPSERVAAPAPVDAPATSASTSSSANDSDNAPLIIGLSLATTALLGGGVLVARRRRVAPGH